MAEILIEEAHKPELAGMQHVLQWLHSERIRLDAELQHVVAQGQRLQGELSATLQHVYGVEPGANWTLDTERGVIVVAESADATAEPAAEG